MENQLTYHIHLYGQVQGVGFRPFVMRLAHRMGLVGWVSNNNDGVHIEINANENKLQDFINSVLEEKPSLSTIKNYSIQEIDFRPYYKFKITDSLSQVQPNTMITPDIATCVDCQKELFNPNSRRYRYPFLSCTNCGVRYSIITKLPYDRANTTMSSYIPCESCNVEYNDLENRHLHSQTQSCSDCGIELEIWEEGILKKIDNEDGVQRIIEAWNSKKIVAIKGLGGYILTCDATQNEVINSLRQRKNRPSKPFAVMFPDLKTLEEVVMVSSESLEILRSPQSPIVLLPLRKDISDSNFPHSAIAPNLSYIGVMLPYMPLFMLLCRDFGKPIIATSANLSNSPIIADDLVARRELTSVADLIISHNREILVPQDDSVARLVDSNTAIWLRRSRGLAPNLFLPNFTLNSTRTLAMGAMIKSSFALVLNPNVYVSQYLGDLDSYDTQNRYKTQIEHFLQLFQIELDQIVVDKHPDYYSTKLGTTFAKNLDIPLLAVQHHKAHFAAVLAENDLLNINEPVLGVIFDGTGLGDDGNIWGGEIFIYSEQDIERVGHLPYFPVILGDKMAKEPRISALCALGKYEGNLGRLSSKFTSIEWNIYQQRLSDTSLQSSSVGRLFDAIASWLGLADRISYEGEAALLLETVAESYYKNHPNINFIYSQELSWESMLNEIIEDSFSLKPDGFVALKFHFALVNWIFSQARNHAIQHIAFSGGVFQNQLLVHLIKKTLASDYRLHFHQQLPPNDENISFGQLVLGQQQNKFQLTNKIYVSSNTR